MSTMTFTSARHARAVVLSPHGDLDFGALPLLCRALAEMPAGTRDVTLDMRDVPFMDVAGVHLMEELRLFGLRRRASVETVGWQRQPLRVLRLNGRAVRDGRYRVSAARVLMHRPRPDGAGG
ncbi:STAS domain-containing protein [Streptomyces montanisoli]|uniref:STAS domain-containing protein n=1 Tax=Streptomyces montanisoli TaxID=2798581 RepID=A0A940RV45_9ACTN|nr:STAS domain-containing protein [Streptomyces montanisoli]MBP0457881.1 STAS domain-containing protein [Streptomyces montanisoli]